ncbi:DUF6112 family protein [Mumia qirimensis]|uniref:DUF6112 family protein n=1 Tax=Mumia qirimensis TaxID=3234852 RepID=UPI00351CF1FA
MSIKSLSSVNVTPNPNELPGGNVIQQILDGLGGWALWGALGALLISTIVWAGGSFAGNFHAASKGKIGVVISLVAALLAGAAPALINFFSNLGEQV